MLMFFYILACFHYAADSRKEYIRRAANHPQDRQGPIRGFSFLEIYFSVRENITGVRQCFAQSGNLWSRLKALSDGGYVSCQRMICTNPAVLGLDGFVNCQLKGHFSWWKTAGSSEATVVRLGNSQD